MVTRLSDQAREEAACFCRQAALPDTLAWVLSLTPLRQRLFAVELADALKEIALTAHNSGLAETPQSGRATAALDGAPEVQGILRKSKGHRPLSVWSSPDGGATTTDAPRDRSAGSIAIRRIARSRGHAPQSRLSRPGTGVVGR